MAVLEFDLDKPWLNKKRFFRNSGIGSSRKAFLQTTFCLHFYVFTIVSQFFFFNLQLGFVNQHCFLLSENVTVSFVINVKYFINLFMHTVEKLPLKILSCFKIRLAFFMHERVNKLWQNNESNINVNNCFLFYVSVRVPFLRCHYGEKSF